jgi:hypothetical protein
MNKRFDNKRLTILLAGLTIVLSLTIIFKNPKEKATLKSKLVELDTSKVSKIILYPKISNGKEVEFNRSNNKWTVRQGNMISATQAGAVQNMFNEVMNMKPQSLAAVNESQWKDFELTDTLGTRVKFLDKKGNKLADLMIGKFDYSQADNPYGSYGGNSVKITSYVRVYNEKEVFAVDGLLPFSFNMKFEDWRDKTFIRAGNNDITTIRFTFPADSSYTLTKKDSVWYTGAVKTDSSAVAGYLNSMKLLEGENFKDNYKPVVNPFFQLQIEGNNLLSISVKCYVGEGNSEYILNSSLNPEVYFSSKRDGIFDKLFKPKSFFVKNSIR